MAKMINPGRIYDFSVYAVSESGRIGSRPVTSGCSGTTQKDTVSAIRDKLKDNPGRYYILARNSFHTFNKVITIKPTKK